VELYWRIGDGPVQHSDGSKPTDIGPITSEPSVAFQAADLSWTTKPGIASVRIVAVNSTKDAVTLSGNVAPQAPKTVASPSKVDKADPNTPVQLRVDMTQVALNFAGATAEWDFGDGSPTEPAKITPDAKMQASVTTTHTFKTTSTGVRVTFRDNAGKALAWDPVKIAVGAASGGHGWVLSSAMPDRTTFNGVHASSSNGKFSASWDVTTDSGQIHTEGALSWAPPPATAAPGDKWTTTLAASYSSTKCVPGQESAVAAEARWWAEDGTPGDDFFRVAADCSSGQASKPLSWAFPAVPTKCGTVCEIYVTVTAMSGVNGASVFWKYTYVVKP
jgi:hypothetical protein